MGVVAPQQRAGSFHLMATRGLAPATIDPNEIKKEVPWTIQQYIGTAYELI